MEESSSPNENDDHNSRQLFLSIEFEKKISLEKFAWLIYMTVSQTWYPVLLESAFLFYRISFFFGKYAGHLQVPESRCNWPDLLLLIDHWAEYKENKYQARAT